MLGTQTLLLARYMDLLTTRQRVVSGNIANADTPGYRTQDFDFQAEMSRALEHGPAETAEPIWVFELGNLPVKNDGNDVQLDDELRLLGETSIRYQLASMLVRGKLQSTRNAIYEGRR